MAYQPKFPKELFRGHGCNFDFQRKIQMFLMLRIEEENERRRKYLPTEKKKEIIPCSEDMFYTLLDVLFESLPWLDIFESVFNPCRKFCLIRNGTKEMFVTKTWSMWDGLLCLKQLKDNVFCSGCRTNQLKIISLCKRTSFLWNSSQYAIYGIFCEKCNAVLCTYGAGPAKNSFKFEKKSECKSDYLDPEIYQFGKYKPFGKCGHPLCTTAQTFFMSNKRKGYGWDTYLKCEKCDRFVCSNTSCWIFSRLDLFDVCHDPQEEKIWDYWLNLLAKETTESVLEQTRWFFDHYKQIFEPKNVVRKMITINSPTILLFDEKHGIRNIVIKCNEGSCHAEFGWTSDECFFLCFELSPFRKLSHVNVDRKLSYVNVDKGSSSGVICPSDFPIFTFQNKLSLDFTESLSSDQTGFSVEIMWDSLEYDEDFLTKLKTADPFNVEYANGSRISYNYNTSDTRLGQTGGSIINNGFIRSWE
jgi:hypothetical protein